MAESCPARRVSSPNRVGSDCRDHWNSSRLARSTAHLLEIVERLKAKNVELRILNLGLDTSTATGKMMLTVIGAIAAFEREIMLERQREGIAVAKAAGKYRGRAPTARRRIGRASVYRVLAGLAEAAD